MFKAAVSLKTGYKMRVRWGGEGAESKKTHRSQLTFEFKMAPELIATQTVQYASKQCDLSDAEDKISAPDAAIKNGTETGRGGTGKREGAHYNAEGECY